MYEIAKLTVYRVYSIGGFRAGTRRNVNWKNTLCHYACGKVGAWES